MAHDHEEVTKMMKDLCCTAKAVTKELIESRIEQVDYQTVQIAGQKMMFCGIRLKGGFVAVGKPSVCISPENWRDEIGQKVSFDNTFSEIWKLEAYRLRLCRDHHRFPGLGVDRLTCCNSFANHLLGFAKIRNVHSTIPNQSLGKNRSLMLQDGGDLLNGLTRTLCHFLDNLILLHRHVSILPLGIGWAIWHNTVFAIFWRIVGIPGLLNCLFSLETAFSGLPGLSSILVK